MTDQQNINPEISHLRNLCNKIMNDHKALDRCFVKAVQENVASQIKIVELESQLEDVTKSKDALIAEMNAKLKSLVDDQVVDNGAVLDHNVAETVN